MGLCWSREFQELSRGGGQSIDFAQDQPDVFGLRMVRQAEGGAIVNVGDWADARPYPDYAAYLPSKAAIR